jgi:hypothetical protein
VSRFAKKGLGVVAAAEAMASQAIPVSPTPDPEALLQTINELRDMLESERAASRYANL